MVACGSLPSPMRRNGRVQNVRRGYDAAFKARAALEALREETFAQLRK